MVRAAVCMCCATATRWWSPPVRLSVRGAAARSAKEAKDEKRKEKQADRDAEREERERTKAEEEK